MISVSTAFKNKVKSVSKQISGYITEVSTPANSINNSNDLQSFTIEAETGLYRTVLRQLTVKSLGSNEFLNKTVKTELGVYVNSTTAPTYYKKSITIQGSQVVGTISNFPLLVSVTHNDFKSEANGGYIKNDTNLDISFYSLADVKLAHEIEKYDPITGEIIAWVLIPSLTNGINTDIYIKFGYTATVNEQNTATLWANYHAVWHMNSTTSTITDATGTYTITKKASTEPQDTVGKIHRAQFFDGVNDFAQLPPVATSTNPWTLQMWNKLQTQTARQRLFNSNFWLTTFAEASATTLTVFFGNGASYGSAANIANGIAYNVWQKLDFVHSGSGNINRFLRNGTALSSTINSSGLGSMTQNPSFVGSQSTTGNLSKGEYEEIRIAKTALSNDFLQTEYNNQNDPSTFTTFGTLEAIGGGTTTIEEKVNYGNFKIVKKETQKGSDVITFKGYDLMYEALKKYDMTGHVFPCTLKQFLEGICTKIGVTLKTATFPNDSTQINSDVLLGVVDTYRQALDYIAELTGSIIFIDTDNQLVVKSCKGVAVETITPSELLNLDMEAKWGIVNSVVLSRQPQNDDIVEKNDASITANGLTEVKFVNNYLADADRTLWIGEIFDEIENTELYPFDANTTGLGYLQIGDRVTIQDPQLNSFGTVILGHKIEVGAGFKERIFAKQPDKTSTNYNTAGIIGQRIKNTEIIVDKQKGEITLVNQELNESLAQITITTENITNTVNSVQQLADANQAEIQNLSTQVSTLEQTAQGLEVAVSGIGGTNLIKNSAGLKGSLKEWQLFDSNGNLIDARNAGTITQNSDVSINSESGSAIQLINQFITQTFATIKDQTYTLYLRYKSNGVSTLSITGLSPIVLPTSANWEVYKHQFVAGSGSSTIRIETGVGITGTFSDIVCKLGDVNGWIQAPNEVYGKNFTFDQDGFTITSLTSSFKSVLDNEKLAVYDVNAGDRIVLLVSKDSGKVTKLTAQDEFVVQRYENTSKSMRIIPTSTGAMIVINS